MSVSPGLCGRVLAAAVVALTTAGCSAVRSTVSTLAAMPAVGEASVTAGMHVEPLERGRLFSDTLDDGRVVQGFTVRLERSQADPIRWAELAGSPERVDRRLALGEYKPYQDLRMVERRVRLFQFDPATMTEDPFTPSILRDLGSSGDALQAERSFLEALDRARAEWTLALVTCDVPPVASDGAERCFDHSRSYTLLLNYRQARESRHVLRL